MGGGKGCELGAPSLLFESDNSARVLAFGLRNDRGVDWLLAGPVVSMFTRSSLPLLSKLPPDRAESDLLLPSARIEPANGERDDTDRSGRAVTSRIDLGDVVRPRECNRPEASFRRCPNILVVRIYLAVWPVQRCFKRGHIGKS